jgi:hypothetical protein
MRVQDFIRAAASPPDCCLQTGWSGCQRRGLDTRAAADIQAEIHSRSGRNPGFGR